MRNLRFNQSVLAMLAPWNVEAIGAPQRLSPLMVPALKLARVHVHVDLRRDLVGRGDHTPRCAHELILQFFRLSGGFQAPTAQASLVLGLGRPDFELILLDGMSWPPWPG